MTSSVYIHIPFCENICSYCDFCKMYYNKDLVNKYLEELKKEVQKNYKNEIIKTIYIGGGTPTALNLKQLEKLFEIIKIFKTKNPEITIEANTINLSKEKINFLKDKVNRISIGVQTFNRNHLKLLERKNNIKNLKNALNTFKNVNIDLMYGFKNQTLKDLKEDLEKIIQLNPSHISTYCLILEPHTKLYIKKYEEIDGDKEYEMYKEIQKMLKQNKYIQYELSNFSKKNKQSKHNLTYWNNEHYYGFGLGASGYIENIRYENTKSLNEYLKGNYIKETNELDEKETLENEFILGFRKIKGINKENFQKKYHKNIKEIEEVNQLLKQNILKENKKNIYINKKYLYTSNEVLINFIKE